MPSQLIHCVLRGFGYLHLEFYPKLWTLKNTRTPPVEVHRPIATYLQFPIHVCFPCLSVCRPRPDSQAHFPHRHPYGLNSSTDNAKCIFGPGPTGRSYSTSQSSSTDLRGHFMACGREGAWKEEGKEQREGRKREERDLHPETKEN